MYSYFSGSTSRWDKLKIALKVTLKSHCSTRWFTKKQAVSALKNNLKGLFELLKRLSEDCTLNHDTREGAQNLLGLINLKFICLLLEYWNDILTHIDHVNILLQTIDIANKMINGLIESMEDIRIDGFNKSLNRAKNMAKSLNIPFVLDEK